MSMRATRRDKNGMGRHAARVLFAELTPIEQPLFRNPNELAIAIAKEDPDYGEATSLGSFLNQILVRRERNLPGKLRAAIEKAVRGKLDNFEPLVRDEWVRKFRVALELDARRSPPASASTEILFDELLSLARSAEEHFIITYRPAEQEHDNPKADSLTSILQARLRLLDPVSDGREDNLPRYVFCLPSEQTCLLFWQKIHDEIRSKTGQRREAVNARLTALNSTAHLRVIRVPRYLCGCPIVVFEPTREAEGFNLYYHMGPAIGTEVSVARMDSEYLKAWRTSVYFPIMDSLATDDPASRELNVEEIPFNPDQRL